MRFEVVHRSDNEVGWFISIDDVLEEDFSAIENAVSQFGLRRVRSFEKGVVGTGRTDLSEDAKIRFRQYKKKGASFYSCFLRKVGIVFIYWTSDSLSGDEFASFLLSNSCSTKKT